MCVILYGRKQANQVVWVGLVFILWVLAIVYVGDMLPSGGSRNRPAFANSKKNILS